VTIAGDLARRVGERRRELGLTEDEVAERAGMDPSYVRALEERADPRLSGSAMLRLAAALETTVAALSGAAQLRPPGTDDPSGRPTLETLSVEECDGLLGRGGVGRIVYHEPRGPVALPVNFKMLAGDVVFRTTASSPLLSATQEPTSFEVDHVDDALGEGWSVLLSGQAHRVAEEAELEAVRGLDIRPWAGGERDVYVRMHPSKVTGRRIRRAGAPPTPVP